jgi:CRISPR/Cas system-associated endoribonuclease Cas2
MSNKLKNNIKGQDRNTKKPLDKDSKIILSVLGIVFAGLAGFVIYTGYTSIKDHREEIATLYKIVAPDFSSMGAAASAEDVNTDKTEGTIGFDAFYELRRDKAKESLEGVRGIIGDDLYVSYLNGLDTTYFKNSVEYDYNDLLNDMDEVLKEAGTIEALYNLYADSNEMPEYTTCADEDCSLLSFIENYTRDDLHDYLKERHDMWESVIQVEADRTNVSESYLNLFYQDEVCSKLDYVDKVQVEVILLNKDTYELGFDTLQTAYDNGQIESKFFDETNKSYLENFSLYKDIDFYDGTFKDLTVDTFQSLFAKDVVQNSVYLGEVGSASEDNSTLIDKLKEIGAPTSDEEVIDYTKLENWNSETLSLGGRNEDDVIYILWKIVPGSCEHTLQIPAQSELKDELEREAKEYLAGRTVSDTIYAEVNDLSEEEVHDLLIENYGFTEDELDDLSEEELRDTLSEAQEAEEAEAQDNLDSIKAHMEEDGYVLDDMSDEDIINLYIQNHADVLGSSEDSTDVSPETTEE